MSKDTCQDTDGEVWTGERYKLISSSNKYFSLAINYVESNSSRSCPKMTWSP